MSFAVANLMLVRGGVDISTETHNMMVLKMMLEQLFACSIQPCSSGCSLLIG